MMRLVNMLWSGHYHKILIPLVTITAVFGFLLSNYGRKKVSLNALGFVLLYAIFSGTLIGVFNGGNPRNFVSHFFGALFMFSIYAFSYKQPINLDWLNQFIRKSSFWILGAFLVVITLFWVVNIGFFGGSLYLGIGTGYLVLPLAYFLVHSKYRLALLTMILILISGKRGPMLAAILVLVGYLPFFLRRKLISALVVSIFLSFIISLLYIQTDGLTDFDSLPVYLASPLTKVAAVNPYAEDYDADLAFSGRNQELFLASDHFFSNPVSPIMGLGFGWSYFFDALIPGSTTTDFNVHYVHLAPANFFFTLGIPVAIFIIFSMWLIFFKAYRVIFLTEFSLIAKVILLFWIGSFANSLSGYSYPIDPTFWLSLAFLSKVANIKSKSYSHSISEI